MRSREPHTHCCFEYQVSDETTDRGRIGLLSGLELRRSMKDVLSLVVPNGDGGPAPPARGSVDLVVEEHQVEHVGHAIIFPAEGVPCRLQPETMIRQARHQVGEDVASNGLCWRASEAEEQLLLRRSGVAGPNLTRAIFRVWRSYFFFETPD